MCVGASSPGPQDAIKDCRDSRWAVTVSEVLWKRTRDYRDSLSGVAASEILWERILQYWVRRFCKNCPLDPRP